MNLDGMPLQIIRKLSGPLPVLPKFGAEMFEFKMMEAPKPSGKGKYIRNPVPVAERPCKIAGCKEPRAIQPSGRVVPACKKHLAEYNRAKMAKHREQHGRKSRCKP